MASSADDAKYWRAAVQRCRHRRANGDVASSADVEIRASDRRGGRGVFALRAFAEGECVLIEDPLVAAQHEANKAHARVCARCFRYVGSVSSAVGRRLLTKFGRDGDNAPSTSSLSGGLTVGDLASLASGEVSLPGGHAFDGPPEHPCVGGCAENVYCSEKCANEAWTSDESLMCLGARGLARDKRALNEFYAHARETNDIFIVAAKAVANMCLRAREFQRQLEVGDGKATVGARDEAAAETFARQPYVAVAHAPWWETVAAPEECEDEASELEFRRTLHTIAQDSLDLLRHAWSDAATEYPNLFTLETYGALIGGFELNNLELVVESPVENYFLAVDDAPEGEEKRVITRMTQPLLDALDKDYDIPCLGTALFSVQSGFNHDCDPNAEPFKDERDITGACTIVARRDIAEGEEITISYLDDDDKSRDERQDALADYGFVCRCDRCENELMATRRR